jgi:hypothetical protein
MAFSPHGFKETFNEGGKFKRNETLPSILKLENSKTLFLTLKKLHE